MPSISVCEYRSACKALVAAALRRPDMYFKSLDELEVFLRGYDTAFGQISQLDRSEMFQDGFSNWLYQQSGLSCASGWAYAIKQQCGRTGDDPLVDFGRYVIAFFESWDGQSHESQTEPDSEHLPT